MCTDRVGRSFEASPSMSSFIGKVLRLTQVDDKCLYHSAILHRSLNVGRELIDVFMATGLTTLHFALMLSDQKPHGRNIPLLPPDSTSCSCRGARQLTHCWTE